MRNFRLMLDARMNSGFSVVVGLDTEFDRIPKRSGIWEWIYLLLVLAGLRWIAVVSKIYWFNRRIVDATSDGICAYKINNAFYVMEGIGGVIALLFTIRYILRIAPDIPILLDAKYGDTRNTNVRNARTAFDVLMVDAVTVLPYFGGESLEPFLDRGDKGVFVTCHTAFPGAHDFQDRIGEENEPLYHVVAQHAARRWNENGNCAVVVGSPEPYDLGRIRDVAGKLPILILGDGAKAEYLAKTVPAGGSSAIFGQSRGIIYASNGSDFAEAARQAVKRLQTLIDQYR